MRKIKKIDHELELLYKRVDTLWEKNESLRETLAFVTNHIDTTNLVEVDALGVGVRYVYDGKLRYVHLGNRNEIIENNDKYIIVKNSSALCFSITPRTIYFKIDKATDTCADVTDLYLKAQGAAKAKATEPKDGAADGT